MNGEESGFRFEVSNVVEGKLGNGEDSFVIYLTVTNLDPKARRITLSMATYVTSGGEQLEQNTWISGYLGGENARIKGNAHRDSGLGFYKTYLKHLSAGDTLYIEAVMPDRAKKLSVRFKKEESQGYMPWTLCNADVEELDVKPAARVVSKALTKGIERLEVFEERFGIVSDKLSVTIPDDYRWLAVAGEILQAGSGPLPRDIKLVAVAYDSEGKVIGTCECSISAQKFAGFDAFSMTFYTQDIGLLATRIRVFPKAD